MPFLWGFAAAVLGLWGASEAAKDVSGYNQKKAHEDKKDEIRFNWSITTEEAKKRQLDDAFKSQRLAYERTYKEEIEENSLKHMKCKWTKIRCIIFCDKYDIGQYEVCGFPPLRFEPKSKFDVIMDFESIYPTGDKDKDLKFLYIKMARPTWSLFPFKHHHNLNCKSPYVAYTYPGEIELLLDRFKMFYKEITPDEFDEIHDKITYEEKNSVFSKFKSNVDISEFENDDTWIAIETNEENPRTSFCAYKRFEYNGGGTDDLDTSY